MNVSKPFLYTRYLFQAIIVWVIIFQIYIFYVVHISISEKPDWNSSQIRKEEEEFPLAYSLVVYRDMDQVKRLLQAIYRPFNLYCIHIDRKTKSFEYKNILKATQFINNIIFPEKSVSIKWGTYSVLDAEISCMEALLKHSKKWKYFINLTGQEWPLKTNLELVRIFKALNNSNLVEKAKTIPGRVKKNINVPHNIHPWHGQVHIMVTRPFVHFLLTDRRVQDFIKFLKKNTHIPDEILFASVSHSHKLRPPGGYSGYFQRDTDRFPSLQRYKLWRGASKCYGKWLRDICIFGKKDIPSLIDPSNPELFANKFLVGINDKVQDFMEEWFYKRSEMVYKFPHLNPFIDLKFYSSLPQVKEHW